MASVNYIIGMSDEDNNYYVVTDLYGNVEESLELVGRKPLKGRTSQAKTVSNCFFYPYNTFNKKYNIRKPGLRWAILKAIVFTEHDEPQLSYPVNSVSEQNIRLAFTEEIKYGISLAKVLIKGMFMLGDFKTALAAREKIMEEQAYFQMYSPGDITSYMELLNYESPDPSINSLIKRDYLFPLTLHNLFRYERLLEKNVPIDYLIIVNDVYPFGVNRKCYISSEYLDCLSLKSFINLFSNLSPWMIEWGSDILDEEQFKIEALTSGSQDLKKYVLFECNLTDIGVKINKDKLFKSLYKDYSHFLSGSNDTESENSSFDVQVCEFYNLLSLMSFKLIPEVIDEMDERKISELINLGVNDYIRKYSFNEFV